MRRLRKFRSHASALWSSPRVAFSRTTSHRRRGRRGRLIRLPTSLGCGWLRVMAKIGLEAERPNPKDPSKPWPPRNTVERFLTPADVGWRRLTQVPQDMPPDVASNGGTPPAQLQIPD